MKEKTLEAGRYALWERTVWSGGGAHQSNGVSKSNDQIARETRARVTGNPNARVYDPADTPDSAKRNPLWTDRRGKTLLATSGDASGDDVVEKAQNAKTHGAGTPENVGLTGAAGKLAESQFDLHDDYVKGGYTQTQRPAIEDWGSLSLSGRDAGSNDGQTSGRGDLIQQSAKGALMTNKWVAANEGEYMDTVTEGTQGKLMRYAEPGLADVGPLSGMNFCMIQKLFGGKGKPAIGEVCYGADSSDSEDLVPDSGTLPPRYVED